MIRRGIGVQSYVSAGVSTDADAQAFITAAGITDATQQTAINTLVTDLKGYGIWTKMKAIYPMVGGTASTHRWNLRDPRDLDAAFRLVFNGGWTHSSNGADPNGTNAYANTFLTPLTSLSLNSTSISAYSNENPTYTGCIMGCYSSASHGGNLLTPRLGSFDDSENSTINADTLSNTNKPTRNDGLFCASRIASNQFKTYRNGVIYNTTSRNSTSLTQVPFYLGARNNFNGSGAQFSSIRLAFASIGDGLTDTEAANFYTAVQKYQTTLNRNI